MDAATPAFGASVALNETKSCHVCFDEYERDLRTPLVLPCGHTFCSSCLSVITASGNFPCPTCRAEHSNVLVEALTVNYSLLNILRHCSDSGYEQCSTHEDNLCYWCCTCQLPLCSLCLHSSHPQGHDVKLTQSFLQEKKHVLVEKIQMIVKDIENEKQELRGGFNDLDALLYQLFRRNACLQDSKETLTVLLADTRHANSVSSILHLEKEVGEFHSKEKSLLFAGDEDVAKAMKQSSSLCQQQSFRRSQEKHGITEFPRAVMDFSDGRLLLHSVAEPVFTRLSLQVPYEVFLELSVGGKYLGSVYIGLWSHNPMAQQFLALCMGTLEPSLLGTKASEKVRSVIVFRFVVDANFPTVRHSPLRTFGRVVRGAEGCVVWLPNNKGLAFGICTQANPIAIPYVPFGTVVAGLEVVKEAFEHNPVTDVTISHCGLVLPGMSSSPPQTPSTLPYLLPTPPPPPQTPITLPDPLPTQPPPPQTPNTLTTNTEQSMFQSIRLRHSRTLPPRFSGISTWGRGFGQSAAPLPRMRRTLRGRSSTQPGCQSS